MDRDSQHRANGETASQAYQRLLKRWEHHRPSFLTDDEEGWTAQDMVRQLQKDRYSARFIEDIEAVASESELKTVKIDDLIQKLRDWYKPARNPTTQRYNFHRLTQKDEESFESFVSKVKFEAKNCNFRCNHIGCDVQNTLIRDQIILGVSNDDLRRRALREEWNLDKLEEEGRSADSVDIAEKFNERLRMKGKTIEKIKNQDAESIKSKLQEKDNFEKEINKLKLTEKEKPKLFEKVTPKTKVNEKDGTKLKFHDKDSMKSKYLEKESTKLKSDKLKHHAKESMKSKHHEKEFTKPKLHEKDFMRPKKEGKSKKHCCRCERDPYSYDHYAAIKIPCHPCNQRGLCSSCIMCTNAVLESQKRYQKLSERDMFGKKLCHLTDETCSASDTEDMYKGKSAKAYYVTDDSGSPSDTETGEMTDDIFVMDAKQNNSLKGKVSKMKTVFRLNGARNSNKGHYRRRRHKNADYKVNIGINGQMVTVTTDTGAEINVLPQHTAEELNLPLQTSEMKISPYGAKPFKVVGKYEGCVTFGSAVVRTRWYIVDKKNIEPLLSGATAELLGIIRFISKPSEHRSPSRRRSSKLKDGSKAKYYLEKLERAFNALGKLNGYDVELYINEDGSNTSIKPANSIASLNNSFENEINWMQVDDSIEENPTESSWTTVIPSPKINKNIKITVDMRQSDKTEADKSDKYVSQQEDIIDRRLASKKSNKSIYDQ